MKSKSANSEKSKYRIRNWRDYNASLCKRGSLTLFIDTAILEEWSEISAKKKIVGSKTYSDSVIQCCLLVKISYHFCLRQSTGFLKSLFKLLNLCDLLVQDYSTLCRRQKSIPIELEKRLQTGENLVIGIDSTGLKVYVKCEWKVRKYGWSKHRTWRKSHIFIDLETQTILSADLTENKEDDAQVGKRMLESKSKNISSFHGDGAYDDLKFSGILDEKTLQVIPPPKNAVVRKPKKGEVLPEEVLKRNEEV